MASRPVVKEFSPGASASATAGPGVQAAAGPKGGDFAFGMYSFPQEGSAGGAEGPALTVVTIRYEVIFYVRSQT